jgi:AraC-like DNA-binding protein
MASRRAAYLGHLTENSHETWGMTSCQATNDTIPMLIRALQAAVFDLEHGPASLGDIANRLALSERTLRRRLRALGTSYNRILQDVRSATAKQWLRDSNLTMESIAWRLGYTETANFRHAFKRWTGQSPQAFRRQLQGARQITDARSVTAAMRLQ